MALFAFVPGAVEAEVAHAILAIVSGVGVASLAHAVDLEESSFAGAALPIPSFVCFASLASVVDQVLPRDCAEAGKAVLAPLGSGRAGGVELAPSIFKVSSWVTFTHNPSVSLNWGSILKALA